MAESKAVRIALAMPNLSEREKLFVSQAIDSSWISSSGAFIDQFEREFAAACEVETALSVCNGTVALHLAMLLAGVGPGDEVIVPSMTYIATANAVRYVGATPVFADVEPSSWGLCPQSVERAITPKTKAIIPVHIYGHPADMDAIVSLAKPRGIVVIEDAAEAHMARYKGRRTGGLGDIGTFSFYGNKIFTSGEGGAITLRDQDTVLRARMLRGQGMDPKRRYYFPIVGYNYRMTNVAAALLCAQFDRSEEILRTRRAIFNAYYERLVGISGLGFRPEAEWAEAAPWLFCLTIDEERFGRSRDEVMALLAKKEIETRPFFIPLHTLPPYVGSKCADDLSLSVQLGRDGLNLPTHHLLSSSDIDEICGIIRDMGRSA